MKKTLSDTAALKAVKEHPVSDQINDVFKNVIKEEVKVSLPAEAHEDALPDQELSLSDDGEFEIDLGIQEPSALDEGLDLSFSEDEPLDLGSLDGFEEASEDQYGDLSLAGDDETLSLAEEDGEVMESLGELDLSLSDEIPDLGFNDESLENESLSLGDMDLGGDDSLSLSDEDPLADGDLSFEEPGLDLSGNDDVSFNLENSAGMEEEGLNLAASSDLSADALEKLKEIDAILVEDASKINLSAAIPESESLDEPLVGEDLNLASLDFSIEDSMMELQEEVPPAKEEKKKKKKEDSEAKEAKEVISKNGNDNYSQDLRELSGAYSGEMDRLAATISNLRSDREELLARIQKLEDEKILQSRQSLTMRAELDEKKIELTIIRKKLNEEINDLKDRLKVHDERRLILEEKNRIMMQELDKAAQKNKIDVKKVQMRERELEQKLELLKSDAETQIRHRDLKILELKRKIDSMEFDMESISLQEKRSVESRYELEDKLEKAIKTLRTAINVLEDESDRSKAVEALKKNIVV